MDNSNNSCRHSSNNNNSNKSSSNNDCSRYEEEAALARYDAILIAKFEKCLSNCSTTTSDSEDEMDLAMESIMGTTDGDDSCDVWKIGPPPPLTRQLTTRWNPRSK